MEKIIIILAVIFVLLVLGGLAVANYSYDELVDKFNKLSNVPCNITPLEFFEIVNQRYFYNSINLELTDKPLSDSFSSRGVLKLCSLYANQGNIAGVSICAHELGHALQFKSSQEKMQKYGNKLRVSSVLSMLVTPLLIAGIVLLFFNLYVAIAAFAIAVIFFGIAIGVKLSTVQIEKEASQNGLKLLKENANLTNDELKQIKDFLNSAKLTYVAEVLRSMLKWTFLVRKS